MSRPSRGDEVSASGSAADHSVGRNPESISGASLHHLRCQYRENPLGIDATRPRLTWVVRSDERGLRQSAYQVMVADTLEALERGSGNWWDSGKVLSDASIQIEYGGERLTSRQCCFWKVRIWDERGRPSMWSEPAFWTMGLLVPEDWSAEWIGLEATSPKLAVPRYFRKEFLIHHSIPRATIYASALGLYELRINGFRVGDHLLTPEWTDYRKRVQYQTYDVTALLQQGENAIAALVGNGWYSGGWQFWQSELKPIYGDQPYLRVQLEIEGEDGTQQIIPSDASWRGTVEGPLRFSGIYEGETYDARREMPNWDTVPFDDRAWSGVSVVTPKVGQLVWQRSEPIRITQEVKPIAVSMPKPGLYVFDLGQNIAGWCRIRIKEPRGTEVTLKCNEVLNADGTLYTDNLHAGHKSAGDRQVIRYISDGEERTYEPHFTYQGFRYVEVSGLTVPPGLDLLLGCVFHTSFEQTGRFCCSNPLLNRLAQNIQWSQRANIMGVPTDCCQRDERCAYTGDMNFFMPTAVYNFNMAAFSNKWLVDLCADAQMPDGHFPDHAPTYGPGDGWNVGWGDAGITCPYVMYRTYGDTQVIREHYSAMKRFLEAHIRTAVDNLRGPETARNGDWLNLGGDAAKEVIASAYYAYDMALMSEMARAIGEEDDASEFAARAARIREAFAEAFVDKEGRIKNSSQTGYALAFTMGLVPPGKHEAMSTRFAEEIARFDSHLATGFIGTPRLLPALHEAGRDDLAYRLLLNETYPSWLYQVKLGATTMWERWDGWKPETGFADPGMNSFNHYAFGAVGEYLYGMVGGIRESAPGYKVVRINPIVGEGLSWVNASFDSPHGLIECNWRRETTGLSIEVMIPANTTGIVILPASDVTTVREGGRPVASVEGVMFLRLESGSSTFAVGSGRYHFTTT